MENVPNNLNACSSCGSHHRQNRREIILVRRGLDQMPADAITHGMRAKFPYAAVVELGKFIMACGAQQIQPLAIAQTP